MNMIFCFDFVGFELFPWVGVTVGGEWVAFGAGSGWWRAEVEDRGRER
jgi:hypothetical protein